MSNKSKINWTDATWNVISGCDRVSPGCAYCYAAKMAKRLKAMDNPRYQRDGGRASGPGFGVTLHPDLLDLPLHWKRPRMVFVNSMSDLFHEKVPDRFIDYVFATMGLAGQHTFQVLTKRPDRMRAYFAPGQYRDMAVNDAALRLRPDCGLQPTMMTRWPLPNVWLGISAESQRWADQRIPLLLETPAAVRFVSCEPLLGPLDLRPWLEKHVVGEAEWPGGPATLSYAPRLDWVIVGGESAGSAERRLVEGCEPYDGHRPDCTGGCHGTGWHPKPQALEWVGALRGQCIAAGVPFFFKAWAGPRPSSGGRLLDGRAWDEAPERLR